MGASFKGQQQLARRLGRIPSSIKEAVGAAQAQNAKELSEAIARACSDDPVLSASVGYTDGRAPKGALGAGAAGDDAKSAEGLVYTVYAGDPAFPAKARWREFGTTPHSEDPKNRTILAFEEGGKAVFAHHVDHPGETAKPFFFGTYRTLKKRMRSRTSRAATMAAKKSASA